MPEEFIRKWKLKQNGKKLDALVSKEIDRTIAKRDQLSAVGSGTNTSSKNRKPPQPRVTSTTLTSGYHNRSTSLQQQLSGDGSLGHLTLAIELVPFHRSKKTAKWPRELYPALGVDTERVSRLR